MKQKYFLITVLSWLSLLMAEAQVTTITIGNDAYSFSYDAPYSNFYKYSTVQMLYTPSEIGKSGRITSIAFKVASASSMSTSEVKVYLGHKSDRFSGTTDYVRSTNLTLVYFGTPTLGQTTGWEKLSFNQGSFNYNGTNDLVVVVTKKCTTYNSSLKYYYFEGGDFTLYRRSDSDTSLGNVTNTYDSYDSSTQRPSVRFEMEGAKDVPSLASIGDNTSLIGNVLPYSNYFSYSTTQSLYTPTEIGLRGKITSIAFEVATTSSLATSEVKVYLGHKSGKFSGINDYVRSANLTLVYSGSPILGRTKGWEKLQFNQGSFNYNGTDNLVVVVTRKSANYSENPKYYYITGSGNNALYRRSDSETSYGDVTNTSNAYNTETIRPSIRIEFEPYQKSNMIFADKDSTFNDVKYTLHPNLTATVKSVESSWGEVTIPSSISSDGEPFAVTEIGEQAFSKYYYLNITMPTSITTIHADAFKNSGILSLFWNGSVLLTQAHIDNLQGTCQNVLIYVSSTSQLATSSLQNVANVVVNNTAKNVVLQDGDNFHCPRQFTASSISFTRNFILTSGVDGVCAGWETIALPFNVKTIRHSTKGELTPFASYSSSSTKKPFWLYSWSSSGWKKASSIVGNTPYIICFPNNEKYHPDYNVGGDITFSATNATVYKSEASVLGYDTYTYANRQFYPTFTYLGAYTTVYAINWGTTVEDAGGETPGSVFLSGHRYVIPFEGFIYSTSGARMFPIFPNEDAETTGILELKAQDSQPTGATVYDLKGQLLVKTQDGNVEQVLRQLPPGMYIVNGKKMMIRR